MNRRTSSKTALLFLLALLLTRGHETRNATRNERLEAKPVHESSSTEEEEEEDRFSLGSTTDSIATTTMEIHREFNEKNVTEKEFRPSLHLGEIKESRIAINNPFNALRHFDLDDGGTTRDTESYDEHSKHFQLVFQPINRNTGDQRDSRQNLHETGVVGSSMEKDAGREDQRVKFRDMAFEVGGYDGASKEVHAFHRPFTDTQLFDSQDQQVFEQGTSHVWGKPSKFQGESPKPEIADLTSGLNAPFHSGAFYSDHQSPTQSSLHEDFLSSSKKPSDGLVYVQESSFTRTRKFPYTIYQPHVGYQQIDLVNDASRPSYPVKKRCIYIYVSLFIHYSQQFNFQSTRFDRASPWTKILHLIGTILPLGLLIAALTPNVVKVDNAT